MIELILIIGYAIKRIFQGIFKVILGVVKFFDRILEWILDRNWRPILNFIGSIFIFPFRVLGFVFAKIIDFVKWFFKTFADALAWFFKTLAGVITWFFKIFGDALVWFIKLILFVVTLRFLFGSDEDNRQNANDLFDRLFPKSKK